MLVGDELAARHTVRPPAQAYLLGAAIGWNIARKGTGHTLSTFASQAPLVFTAGWTALSLWLIPHIWRRKH